MRVRSSARAVLFGERAVRGAGLPSWASMQNEMILSKYDAMYVRTQACGIALRLAVLEAGLPLRLLARDLGELRKLLQQMLLLLLRAGLQVVCAAGIIALFLGDNL